MANFLGLRPTEKTAFFIDGANLYKAARNLGFDIDYKNLLATTQDSCALVRASYYTAIQEDRDQDYSPLRPLVDWLDYNGYTMVHEADPGIHRQPGTQTLQRIDRHRIDDRSAAAQPAPRPCCPVQRKWRFSPRHRGDPSHGRPGERRFHGEIIAAYGVRRTAPAG